MLHPHRVHAAVRRIRAFRLVVAADAEVVGGGARHRVTEPQRLIEGDRVIELPADELIAARRLQAQRVCQRPTRHRRIQIRSVVGIDPEGVEEERAPLLHQRPAHPESVVDIALRTSHRHERAASAQRIAPHRHVREVAQGPDARLRDDFDRHAARRVKFRRELIARDANRLDHRFRRQRAAFEAVDANHRARPRHVFQLAPQRCGIVRQRFDLFAGQRRAEGGSIPIRSRLLPVLLDRDGRFHALDRQHRDLAILAAAKADVGQNTFFEAWEFCFDRVASRPQRRYDRDAGISGLRRYGDAFRRLFRSGDGDSCANDDGVRLIDDSHPERGRCRLLRRRRRRERSGEERSQEHHFGAWNFLGSILTFTLTRSNVVSSIVLPATARRMRNGHLMPLTVR